MPELSKHNQATNGGGNVHIGDDATNVGDGNGHDNTPMSVPKSKPTKSIKFVTNNDGNEASDTEQSAPAPVTSIQKPAGFSLDRFKSKRAASVAGLDNLVDGMPHFPVGQVKDFFRLHPSEEEYWSSELCFVPVPIKGQKRDTLHLIDEDLAMDYLPSGKIKRFRLALATKPFDVFFFIEVPSQNLDNGWNTSAITACEQAKTLWTQATSRKEEGIDSYKVDKARNQEAFPDPRWPRQSLEELINKTFMGRMIIVADHPALLRLIGDKQSLS